MTVRAGDYAGIVGGAEQFAMICLEPRFYNGYAAERPRRHRLVISETIKYVVQKETYDEWHYMACGPLFMCR